MKTSQVKLFFTVFNLGHPEPALGEVWERLNQVVIDRNNIAHGTYTAGEVGRGYTIDDVLALVYLWHLRWDQFLHDIESKAQHREFYRA